MNLFLEKYNDLLKKGMFLMTFIVFYGFSVIGKIFVEILDINNTMGWKHDVWNTWIDGIPIVTTLVFSVGYLILLIFKIKSNIKLSAIHLLLIGLSSFLYNFLELDLRIILSVFCLSIAIFAVNIYNTLLDRKNKL